MLAIEWVSLYEAADRLQTFWTIPASIAEKIVVNVVHGGSAQVRAKDRHQASLVFQNVTGKIQLSQAGLLALSHAGLWALSQASSWAPDYEEIEIDWNGLLEEGRKLLPSWIQIPQSQALQKRPTHKRDEATEVINDLWPLGVPNQKDLSNVELCRTVADKIAERRRQQHLKPINISDDTILRAAGRLR